MNFKEWLEQEEQLELDENLFTNPKAMFQLASWVVAQGLTSYFLGDAADLATIGNEVSDKLQMLPAQAMQLAKSRQFQNILRQVAGQQPLKKPRDRTQQLADLEKQLAYSGIR